MGPNIKLDRMFLLIGSTHPTTLKSNILYHHDGSLSIKVYPKYRSRYRRAPLQRPRQCQPKPRWNFSLQILPKNPKQNLPGQLKCCLINLQKMVRIMKAETNKMAMLMCCKMILSNR